MHNSAANTIDSQATRTVLVVDDDPRIRALVCRALREDGFDVLEACYAEDALRTWAHHRDVIDIVVSDVVMPGRSGHALVKELQDDKPSLMVVLVSGCTLDKLEAFGLANGEYDLVRKPFVPSQLVAAVRAARPVG